MSKSTNSQLLSKFETIKRWMVNDLDRAMFPPASANFLVAQGLLAYTEIIGSFITGQGEGFGGKNFDTFFERLGSEYGKLLRRHNGKRKRKPHVVYDDLRCGMLHEYAIKRKGFVVYNAPGKLTDEQIRQINEVDLGNKKIQISSGVVYVRGKNNIGFWLIIDPIYWIDFKMAVERYWEEINNPKNKELRKAFFKRARKINLKDHRI